ncbi:right-handed parallel beta-helix repeat-containing protein [Methanobrevibacter sp. TMH8]|nr:carboxypeptidase-like regulatory domain-containing protein [Methanobrevibacter sp. TMH8]MBZ9570049.1 right-handed parallel beta-helix repeat-containing protein [Methanobrevibacter sp. TMH8]
MTFIDCVFENNTATSYAGAIYNSGNNLEIKNCTFTNNTATSYGGAIYSYGNNLEIKNCTFTNNRANHAGAIYSQSSNFKVIGSIFTNNRANSGNYYGGAIFDIYGSNSTLTNCNFTNNTAGWGGAIFYYLTNDVTITNTTFEDNVANWYGAAGGAIYAEGNNYKFIDCNFTNNEALYGYGGAIIHHGANHSVSNSTFTNNRASNSGGAIYIHNFSSAGTATYNFKLTNCTFINNTADIGGAIYNQCNSSTITNSNFIANNALNRGGAIGNVNNLTVTDSNFTDNTASNHGGAIYNNVNSNISVLRNIMSGNSANLGQMIYNNGTISVLNLIFIDNSTWVVKKGSTIILNATLTDDMGNTITGQNISFYVNGSLVGSVESIEGYANITYLVNGVEGIILPVNGSYNGIGNYPIVINNGELLIQLLTNSTINAPDGKVGDSINVSGIATDEEGNPIANTQISVTIDGKTYNITTNSNGEWNLIFTPETSGNFTAIVSWTGNSSHNGFTNSTTFNIDKLNTSVSVVAPDTKVNQTINISGVLIDENGNPVANAQLNVIVDGKIYNLTTDSNGHWSLPYTPTRAGSIEVLVNFAGNYIYLSSENATIFNVEANNGVNETNETNEINETNENNEINESNGTNETNESNKTSINSVASATMKKTGMPIIIILLILLSSLGLSSRRK